MKPFYNNFSQYCSHKNIINLKLICNLGKYKMILSSEVFGGGIQ